MKTLIVFDIDGTLVNSVKLHQVAFDRACRAFGFLNFSTNWSSYKEHTDSAIFRFILETEFRRPATQGDLDRFENLLLEFTQQEINRAGLDEIAGAGEILAVLNAHPGFDLVFATGSLIKPARLKLAQVGMSSDSIPLLSSNLEVFERARLVSTAIDTAKRHHGMTDYQKVISFGDGFWDLNAAKTLGLEFVGISNRALLEHKPGLFFNNFLDSGLHDFLELDMNGEPDFEIKSKGEVSIEFLNRGIRDFKTAAEFVRKLPYGRNSQRDDFLLVFRESKGTCSTKHALLKRLAEENNYPELKLVCGLYRMNEKNTRAVAATLKEFRLNFIPEAHNYLKYRGRVYDYTKPSDKALRFLPDLLEEIELMPEQVANYKVEYHRNFLKKWLQEQPGLKYDLDELWRIREHCIQDLSDN